MEAAYEDLTSCGVCSNSYDSGSRFPRMMVNCGHSMCTDCFVDPRVPRDEEGRVLCHFDRIACTASQKNYSLVPSALPPPPTSSAVKAESVSGASGSNVAGLLCEWCEDGVEKHPATQRCLDCEENTCDSNVATHRRAQVF